MSVDGDLVRVALKAHDLTAGVTPIDAEHDPACRHCAALAALARLEAERETFRQEALAANKEQWKAKAQRDALAEALRRVLTWELPQGSVETFALPDWLADRARAALAEAGLE